MELGIKDANVKPTTGGCGCGCGGHGAEAAVETAPVLTAPSCGCGPDCTCGCQEGKPCTCGAADADAGPAAPATSDAKAAPTVGVDGEATSTYRVTGMTCGHCVKAVTEEVSAIAGVSAVEVDLETGALRVTSATPIDFDRIVEAVAEAGDYKVE